MTEEKKAMEENKNYIKELFKELENEKDDIQLNCAKAELKLMVEELLDLIEKQQKEIEELKEITKMYDSYIGEKMPLNSKIIIADRDYFINGTFVNNYISKDKIKDKIKKLKIDCNICELEKLLDCDTQCTIGGTIKALNELI